MMFRGKIFRYGPCGGVFFAAVALGVAGSLQASSLGLASASTNTVLPPLILIGKHSPPSAGTVSPSITEILQMLDARVDAQVILAYIQNSPVAYDPDAATLILLRDHGASTEILLALMHHGQDLRLRSAQLQAALSATTAVAAGAQEYAPEAATEPPPGTEVAYPAGPAYPDSGELLYPAAPFYGYAYDLPYPWWTSVHASNPLDDKRLGHPPVHPAAASNVGPTLLPPQFGFAPNTSPGASWPALPPPQFGITRDSSASVVRPNPSPPQFGLSSRIKGGASLPSLPPPQFGLTPNNGHASSAATTTPGTGGPSARRSRSPER